jgi:hypothetical protein
MLNIFSSTTKDDRIKDLESEVERLTKLCRKREAKIMRFSFFVEEFKKFSPRLWFEYFSPDAGMCSASKRAEKRYQQWLLARDERRQAQNGN